MAKAAAVATKTLKVAAAVTKTLKVVAAVTKTLKVVVAATKTLKVVVAATRTLKVAAAATKTLKATRTLKANAAKASAAVPYSQPFLTLEEKARITRAFFVLGAGGNFIPFRPLRHPMNTAKSPKGYKVTTGTLS